MIGDVTTFDRTTDEADGSPVADVQCDAGGNNIVTAELFQAPGEDSPPLPDVDVAVLVESSGTEGQAAVAYHDRKNAGKAQPGERRFIARAADGTPVAEFWAKQNGDVQITSLASGGKITINGVEIDQDGNITTPGNVKADQEVTAMASGPGVKLSTHLHPTPMGPSGAPTPGT